MSKKNTLLLMALNAVLWLVPFVDSYLNHARSMQDLTVTSQIFVIAGLLVFAVLMYPLFAAIWGWLKKWINGN